VQHFIAERQADERGFTLIELMVVVLIIAILLAIAIPTFLGARSKAQNRAAQSGLRNALTAEKTYYTDTQAYSALPSDITKIEPNLVFDTDSTQGIVLVQPSGATDVICLTRTSAGGDVFSIWESATAGVQYGKTALTAGNCAATPPASGFTSTSW
jgi:type IV pilus assembly protein PilA